MKNMLPGAVEVTFQRRGRSARTWVAIFNLGSEAENTACILREAWNLNSRILAVRPLVVAA